MMRVGRMQSGFLGFKSFRYRIRIAAGRVAQSLGYRKAVSRPDAPAAETPPQRVMVLTRRSGVSARFRRGPQELPERQGGGPVRRCAPGARCSRSRRASSRTAASAQQRSSDRTGRGAVR